LATTLSLDSASHRFYWEVEGDEARAGVFAIWLRLSLRISTLVTVASSAIWLVASALGHRSAVFDLGALWALSLPFRVTHQVRLQWARVRRRPLEAAGWALAMALPTIGLGALFVLPLGLGGAGVVGAQTVAAVVVGTASVSVGRIRRMVTTLEDPAVRRRMLRFSLPLIPTALASWVLAVGDRWILSLVYNDTAVGLYQAAFTVVGLISLPLAAFNQAFPPFAFSIHRDADAPLKYRRILDAVLVGSTILAVVVSLSVHLLLRILANAKYADAATMVPYLAFSLVAQAALGVTAIGCNVAERNRPIAIAIAVGAVSIPVVVAIAHPFIGQDSVALSTLVSQTIAALWVTRSSEALWPVGYRWRVPVGVLGALVATLAVVNSMS